MYLDICIIYCYLSQAEPFELNPLPLIKSTILHWWSFWQLDVTLMIEFPFLRLPLEYQCVPT